MAKKIKAEDPGDIAPAEIPTEVPAETLPEDNPDMVEAPISDPVLEDGEDAPAEILDETLSSEPHVGDFAVSSTGGAVRETAYRLQ